MSQSSAAAVSGLTGPSVALPTIPLANLAAWFAFVGLLALLVIFFVSADQGAVSIPAGNAVHEWVHDARHLLGYPCH